MLTKFLHKSPISQFCILFAVIMSFSLLVASFVKLADYKKENARLANNCIVLTDSVKAYRVSDSLNACQVAALRLTADEYKKLYSDEHELVRQLQADKVGLMATVALQQKTVQSLQASLKPVYVRDTMFVVIDTVHCFSYSDKWTDISGCISDSTLTVDLTTRDELLIVESAQRKRFLGIPLSIKWFGYKSRTIDAVNKNPNTVITCIDYKTIEK